MDVIDSERTVFKHERATSGRVATSVSVHPRQCATLIVCRCHG